jgi:hypothetical protein
MVFMGVQTLKAGAELTLLVVVIAVNYMFFNSNIMKAAEGAISKVAQIERDFNPIWAGADLIAGTKKARGSVTADCPPGYKNMGLYCANGPSSYAIGASTLADCPSGYTNMGTFCGRGFLKLGHTCDLGKCGTCPAGRFKGALNRCYLNCKAGYTNTGTYCGKGASTNTMFSCNDPAFPTYIGGRCYANCPKGTEASNKIWCNTSITSTAADSARNAFGNNTIDTAQQGVSFLRTFPGGLPALVGLIVSVVISLALVA